MTFKDLNFIYNPQLEARVAKIESDEHLIMVYLKVPDTELYSVVVYEKYNPTLYIQPATYMLNDVDIAGVNETLKKYM